MGILAGCFPKFLQLLDQIQHHSAGAEFEPLLVVETIRHGSTWTMMGIHGKHLGNWEQHPKLLWDVQQPRVDGPTPSLMEPFHSIGVKKFLNFLPVTSCKVNWSELKIWVISSLTLGSFSRGVMDFASKTLDVFPTPHLQGVIAALMTFPCLES